MLMVSTFVVLAALVVPVAPTAAQEAGPESPAESSEAGPPPSDQVPAPVVIPPRWTGGQPVADPSTGRAEYKIDPLTGRIVWPEGSSGYRDRRRGDRTVELPEQAVEPSERGPDVAPIEQTPPGAGPIEEGPPEVIGFAAGRSEYRGDLSTDRVHVWVNPDGSQIRKYGTRPFDVDAETGEPIVADAALAARPDGSLVWGAGSRLVEVPASTVADTGEAAPVLASLLIEDNRFDLGYAGQGSVPVSLGLEAGTNRPGARAEVGLAQNLVGGADVEVTPLSHGVKSTIVADDVAEATGLVEVLSVPAGWSLQQGDGPSPTPGSCQGRRRTSTTTPPLT